MIEDTRIEPMPPIDMEALDAGIRDVVQRLRDAGFETTDSGDGVSKSADWYASGEAIPFPHVVAAVDVSLMIPEAERMALVLGHGWNVEAEYQTLTKRAHLFARTLDEREATDEEVVASVERMKAKHGTSLERLAR